MLNRISCVLADDEPLARLGLKKYIELIPELDLIGECKNGHELNLILSEKKPEVVFLDIEMPLKTGFNAIENLQYDPMIIVTTAYSEYAVKGFELDVVDYLVKPFEFQRLKLAAARALELIQLKKANSENTILVKENKSWHRLKVSEIMYVQALENYVVIHTTLKKFIVKQTLSATKEKLQSHRFLQVHKSYIINPNFVQSINDRGITISNVIIPLGNHFKKNIKSSLVQ